VGDLYHLVSIGDLENPALLPYTIDDIIFALILEIGFPEVRNDDIKNDIAASTYLLQIFTKSNEKTICRIKNMELITTQYRKNISDLIYYNDEKYGTEATVFRDSPNQVYGFAGIKGGYFKFPRPKNNQFSIKIEIEIEKSGQLSYNTFTYDYTIKYIDSWFKMII
jgi:hypothetical protein